MSFAFLTQPPPQKAKPDYSPPCPPLKDFSHASHTTIAVNTRRRSHTTASLTISSWVAQVKPGSPAPLSPDRRLSFSWSSVTSSSPAPSPAPKSPRHTLSASCVPSASFLNLADTPTTAPTTAHTPDLASKAAGEVHKGLLEQGYASVFLHLPSPTNPKSAPHTQNSTPLVSHTTHKVSKHAEAELILKSIPVPPIPTTPSKSKTFARLRSLSFKGKLAMSSAKRPSTSSGSSHPTVPPVPSKSSHSTRPSTSHGQANANPATRYAQVMGAPGIGVRMPLHNEVQLSQLLDGGSRAHATHRVMSEHARATSKAGSKGGVGIRDGHTGGGVSAAYRDAEGRLWMDEDEEWEVQGLLNKDGVPRAQARVDEPKAGWNPLKKIITQKSSHPSQRGGPGKPSAPGMNEDWEQFSPASPGDLPTNQFSKLSVNTALNADVRRGSASSSSSIDSDLDVQYRVTNASPGGMAGVARHLAKPVHALDADAFGASPVPSGGSDVNAHRMTRRERPRPAPLTLAPPSAPHAQPVQPSAQQIAAVGRRDFLENSFSPPQPSRTPQPTSSSNTPQHPAYSSRRASLVPPSASRSGQAPGSSQGRASMDPGYAPGVPLTRSTTTDTAHSGSSKSKLPGFLKRS